MTDIYDRYCAWLVARTEPAAEVMAGLHGPDCDRVRLDAAGLEANDWPASFPSDLVIQTGERLAWGGYDEDRAIYDGPVFAAEPGAEARSVHLAIDVFAAAGALVFAPLAGRVHSFQDNANPKDYGPTLLLEHDVGDLTFWTLYGHLSRDSLDGLYVGRPFAAGDRIGALGDARENGGWPPHLHVQVILDLMGRSGDFPGVFKPSERERWKRICPDPVPLLGIDHNSPACN